MVRVLIALLLTAASSFAASVEPVPCISPPSLDVCLEQPPIFATYGCLKIRFEGLPENVGKQLLSEVRESLEFLDTKVKTCLGDCYCKELSLVLNVQVSKNDKGFYTGKLVFTDESTGKRLTELELSPVGNLPSLLKEIGYAVGCSAITSVAGSYKDAAEKYESLLRRH